MNNKEMFLSYSTYLKNKYGKAAYRVSIDGGFSCPHRNSDGSGGCSYCDELGAVAVYQRSHEASMAHPPHAGNISSLSSSRLFERGLPVEQRKKWIIRQIDDGMTFLKRRYGASLFLLYFQAFTGTYAPVAQLKELYDFALSRASFKELIVSTRPDCVSRSVADLLASYRTPVFDVWVELGLQSSHDKTLSRINRGHDRAAFEKAFSRLRDRGLKITVHLIFGLPGEGRKEIMETIDYIVSLKPEGIKIHNLHIPVGTALFTEYLMGELTVPSGYRHLAYVLEALERLPPEIIIHRLTCDTPPHRLGAPRTFFKKGSFLNMVKKEMKTGGLSQGERFLPSH